MKKPQESIRASRIHFQKIRNSYWREITPSNLMFMIMSQSGFLGKRGVIYLFTREGAFVSYPENTKSCTKHLSFTEKWNRINLYFCDFLVINPAIYNTFITQLYARNIRDFWFDVALEMYQEGLAL